VAADKKESAVEVIKRESDHLRGTIAEAIQDGTSYFTEDNIQLLKFHGMYQQDDRDLRKQLKKEGKEKAYSMMIRARIPGGVLSAQQYLGFDDISDTYGNGTMRITTRQTFQLHGILKGDVKPTLQSINKGLITTLGGCGDQVRNIIACANPTDDNFHHEIREDLMRLVDKLSAKTNAYHEIWLDGEKLTFEDGVAEEPFYGDVYLPRKFKLGIAVEGDNCADVYANDLGIVAHPSGDAVGGYTLLVGGGMGRTITDKLTFPRLATPLMFVTREELVEVAVAIVSIQKDFGNRAERRYSRFKYLLEERGMAWFANELATRLGRVLTPPRELIWNDGHDHLGLHTAGNGKYYLGVYVQNGRLQDTPALQLKSTFRRVIAEFQPTVHLTTQQNIIFSGLTLEAAGQLAKALQEAGVMMTENLSQTVINSMACVALPTCGLATAESERALPLVLPAFEAMFADLDLQDEPISIRMTGCSNGCARPFIADIAFVGRSPGKYDLLLGGDFLGTRLNQLFKNLVPLDDLVNVVRPIAMHYKTHRFEAERFSDFIARIGIAALQKFHP